jgi:hypothetical protein
MGTRVALILTCLVLGDVTSHHNYEHNQTLIKNTYCIY